MRNVLKLAAGTALATVLMAAPAFAVDGYSTAHLNLRTGPGTQYPVVGVMEYNVRSQITGCLADYSWCSITVAGLSGWASADYLVTDEGGQILKISQSGSSTGIPIVAAADVTAIVAPATVGVVVGPAGNVAAIVPEPAVVQYISATPVPVVHVEGELVVGAVVPAAVQLYQIPNSTYVYAMINQVPVVVDPAARTIVYIHRA